MTIRETPSSMPVLAQDFAAPPLVELNDLLPRSRSNPPNPQTTQEFEQERLRAVMDTSVGIHTSGACYCAESEGIVARTAVSACQLAYHATLDLSLLLSRVLSLHWEGHAGELFRTQCAQLQAQLEQERERIDSEKLRFV
ncbi:hypothetical protein [Alloscardovia criceti]|uniref:hypothetical protein n=1 Tax=Alloscardovia criceti TaxID=356828 RepID=UPI0012EAB565|nr:hypothetical protein [Alloscardovia criceti]